ncbi:MAG: DegT/DnrJ/EryC1/StrS family aminotransferase [Deltaproteobacteria bacterium]|jgi:dTDP-4-amino-4,6-dideoxygalactose transaminase|nr:DegT/DnrJ/EryC1/StrS family aminotransferase [Deltaproteobacteria bacterium]
MQIPMVDLKGQYQNLKDELLPAINRVLETTQFVLGPEVESFEREIADYLGAKHAVGVASGTDALHLAVLAAGIGPGDEVITSPFTFIATAEAIAYVGATPVFVDIDPNTFNLDPGRVAEAVTDRTRAVIPVHLFGQPADLNALQDICRDNNLLLIEDCAQSCGADYHGQMTGTWGELGCFSFFPSKNLGCFGDGGLVTTSDETLCERLQVLRNHGSRERYHHSIIGFNSRLDSLQAAVLRVKLKHLTAFNHQRRAAAHRYSQRLAEFGIHVPFEDGRGTHVYHQYTILLEDRDAVQKALAAEGIASAIYYPIPLHRQDVFADQCRDTSLPVSESVAKQVLSLPMFPEMTTEQVDRVVETIAKVRA